MSRAADIFFARCGLCIWFAACLCAPVLCEENAPEPVFDNDYVRVYRLSLAPGSRTQLRQARDTVLIHLKDGESEFLKSQSLVAFENSEEKATSDVIVELKKHWDAEVRPCAAPMKCTRETMMGGSAIAWTTTLFSNGFVTAMRHKLVRGGTLSSSYYSAKGSDHILLIPITELQGNFGGLDEQLKAGQAYFTDATEVEITAKDAEARWIVIRLHAPGK